MNTPDSNKNLAAWNEQALDTWHDIVISFEYCRYNTSIAPTGGFAVVLFNAFVNMPHNGGPGYALGYNPSSVTEYCKLRGYGGLDGAFVGVGFDSLGEFAKNTDRVDGTASISPNSFAVRGGVEEDYRLLYNSSDIQYLNEQLSNFTVDEFISSPNDASFRAVRIILTENCTLLTVQLKEDYNNDEFVTVKRLSLPQKLRTSVRVGITNTTNDPDTMFKIRNFNVAGFPGETVATLISDCSQDIRQNYVMDIKTLPVGQEFVSVPLNGSILTYTTNGAQYRLKNTAYGNLKILGDDGRNVLITSLDRPIIDVYRFLGEKLVYTASINSPDSTIPVCGDIDSNTLVFCTTAGGGNVYVYTYNNNVDVAENLGTWELSQTINYTQIPLGFGLGTSIALSEGNMLIGNNNSYVHALQYNNLNTWAPLQTITCPYTGTSLFGYALDIQGRDAIIGAPNVSKPKFGYTGEGEAFHYYLSNNTNQWGAIMGISNFYNINTLAGNFGESVRIKNNYCIVGSPGEMWLKDPTYWPEDQPNVGRAYVFRKTDQGFFSQGTVLYPSSAIKCDYLFFGKAVNMYDRYAFVASPFYSGELYRENKSFLSIFDTGCFFASPPAHLAVPLSAIDIIDDSGFVISFDNNTYLVEPTGDPLINDPGISTQTSNIAVISTYPLKLEIVPYGSEPIYIQWKRGGLNLTNVPIQGLTAVETQYAMLSDQDIYYAMVSNIFETVTSRPIAVTVYYLPYFYIEPTDITIANNRTTTLSAFADASPAISYQWYYFNGFIFTQVIDGSGGTTPKYTTNTLLAAGSPYLYKCTATNAVGATDSRIVTVTVV